MVMNLSLRSFCENLKATKPPYNCPVVNCGKRYMSYAGIRYHLYHFDHEQTVDSQLSSVAHSSSSHTSDGKHAGDQWHHSPIHNSLVLPEFLQSFTKDTFSPNESKQVVEFNINGQLYHISHYEPLDIIDKRSLSSPHSHLLHVDKVVPTDGNDGHLLKMPVADFRILEEYVRPAKRPTSQQMAYYRYVEKTADELNEEVEYDMDEEDCAWLELMNDVRKEQSFSEVSNATFELVMDRFEKEAFFLSQSPSKKDRLSSSSVDEDAVCVICMDGECQNSNVILFCDMCNLAVHQECYGVPYIPEGQWLCRRCLQSPSRAIDCCLCPNKGGAFKQTSDGRWAHVVCALWIPEVCFANTVFLEPIDSIENIPSARWRLMCYICRQRQTGASIQCHRPSCYTAFHVTCAQQAGLYMKIIPVTETNANGISVTNVCKTAFCDVHSPLNTSPYQPMINHSCGSDDMNGEDSKSAATPAEAKAISREKMKQARKILAEKRRSTPAISIPVLSNDTLMQIAGRININNKEDFLSRLKAYWTLKRQSRNGVPLLRRLQAYHFTKNKDQLIQIGTESSEMKRERPPTNYDDIKMHASDAKTAYDTGISDETASNSEESNCSSKDFAVKPVASKLDIELKELKIKAKPEITLPSGVCLEASAAMSPGDNGVSVRRSTRVVSGGRGSPFHLIKCQHMFFNGKVKMEKDPYKQIGCEADVVEETQNKEKSVVSLKIQIPKRINLKRKHAGYPMDHLSRTANSDDKIAETVLKGEQKLRKKRKLDDGFADVVKEEPLIEVEHTGMLGVQQAEEGIDILNNDGLYKKKKRIVETVNVISDFELESFKIPRESPKRSIDKRMPKKCKENWDIGHLAIKKKQKYGNDGVNVKSLVAAGCIIKTHKQGEMEDITEPGMKSCEDLKHLQRLRQNLERVRLLVELIQKREKMKLFELQLLKKIVRLRLMPFTQLLYQTLERLKQKDTRCFFAKPVSAEDVPDYLDHIHYPMDFSTMRLKIEAHQYQTVGDFKSDFDLIISNCMTYNAIGTIYYSAAVRLHDQGQYILEDARRMEAAIGYDLETGLHLLNISQQNGLTVSGNQSCRPHISCHVRKESAEVHEQLLAPKSNCFASCIERKTKCLPVVTHSMVNQMSAVDSSPRLTRSASARKTDLCESLVPGCTSTPLQAVIQETNYATESKGCTEKLDDSFKMKRNNLCQTDLKTIQMHGTIQVNCAAGIGGRKDLPKEHENGYTSASNSMIETSEHLLISPINSLSSTTVFDSEVTNWNPEKNSRNSTKPGYPQLISRKHEFTLPMKQLPCIDLSHFEQPLFQPALELAGSSPLVELTSIKQVITRPLPPGSLPLTSIVPAQTESESSVIEPLLLKQAGVLQSGSRKKEAAGSLLELIEDVQTTGAASISVWEMESHAEPWPTSPTTETISVITLEPGYTMHTSEDPLFKQLRGHHHSAELEQSKRLEERQGIRLKAKDSFNYHEPIEMEQLSITEMSLPIVTEADPGELVHKVERSAHCKSVSLQIMEDFLVKSSGCLIDVPASELIPTVVQCNTGNQNNYQLSAHISVDRESDSYNASAVCSPILQSSSNGPSSSDSKLLEFNSADCSKRAMTNSTLTSVKDRFDKVPAD